MKQKLEQIKTILLKHCKGHKACNCDYCQIYDIAKEIENIPRYNISPEGLGEININQDENGEWIPIN